MVKIIIIGLGGAIGTVLRYFVSGAFHRYSGIILPVGTLGVNLIGSLCIGLLWGAFETVAVSTNVRSFLAIGVLGAFTTFSTFTLENFHLLHDGEFKIAFLNVIVNNIIGIVLVFGGYFVSRAFLGAFK